MYQVSITDLYMMDAWLLGSKCACALLIGHVREGAGVRGGEGEK